MEYYNESPEATFEDLASKNFLIKILLSDTLKIKTSNYGITPEAKVAPYLEAFLIRVKREDYLFNRKYRVKNTFKKPRGKWTLAIAESVLLDYKDFHKIYSHMFFNRIMEIIDRDTYTDNRTNMKTSDSLHMQDYNKFSNFIQSARETVNNSKMEHYAF